MTTRTIDTIRANHGPALAVAASKHLQCVVTFSHWQAPTRAGGPELPVFNVPADAVTRARALGLTVR